MLPCTPYTAVKRVACSPARTQSGTAMRGIRHLNVARTMGSYRQNIAVLSACPAASPNAHALQPCWGSAIACPYNFRNTISMQAGLIWATIPRKPNRNLQLGPAQPHSSPSSAAIPALPMPEHTSSEPPTTVPAWCWPSPACPVQSAQLGDSHPELSSVCSIPGAARCGDLHARSPAHAREA